MGCGSCHARWRIGVPSRCSQGRRRTRLPPHRTPAKVYAMTPRRLALRYAIPGSAASPSPAGGLALGDLQPIDKRSNMAAVPIPPGKPQLRPDAKGEWDNGRNGREGERRPTRGRPYRRRRRSRRWQSRPRPFVRVPALDAAVRVEDLGSNSLIGVPSGFAVASGSRRLLQRAGVDRQFSQALAGCGKDRVGHGRNDRRGPGAGHLIEERQPIGDRILLAAGANSSMKLSVTKTLCDGPTLRQKAVGIPGDSTRTYSTCRFSRAAGDQA
jgi:hypothetical protein